jgi:hypothetical protein
MGARPASASGLSVLVLFPRWQRELAMNLKLHLLESFSAQGSDGAAYKVRAYERMAQDPSIGDGQEHWQSTGVIEFRLDDGSLIDARADGSMRVLHTGVGLARR